MVGQGESLHALYKALYGDTSVIVRGQRLKKEHVLAWFQNLVGFGGIEVSISWFIASKDWFLWIRDMGLGCSIQICVKLL